MATSRAMWDAAGGLCCCCAKPLPEIDATSTYGQRITREHVFPRSPAPGALRKIATFTVLFPWLRHVALAHSKCNQRKGNRAPTGCEVVFLMGVVARLGSIAPGRTERASVSKRTKKRRAQRARSNARKRLAIMQKEIRDGQPI